MTSAPALPLAPDAARKVVDLDIGHLRRMRFFRRQYDARRLYFYRQYVSNRDQQKFPDGVTPRSNTFVPYPQANVESVVSRVMSNFFSFQPWFQSTPRYAASDQGAQAMGDVLRYQLRKADFRHKFESLVRNICIYGHGGMLVEWDFDFDEITYPEPIPATFTTVGPNGEPIQQPVLDPNTGLPVIAGYQPATKRIPRACPKFHAIDCYDLLVDPDQQIVAHLTERTLGDLKREAEAKPDMYFPDAVAKLIRKVTEANPEEPDSTIIRMAQLWKAYDHTTTVMTFGEDNDAVSWKDARASLRAAGLSSFKRKCWAGEPILLWHGANPFMHQRIPLVMCDYIKLPNEVFGLGEVECISDLAEGINRFVNMIADNWNLGINHRYAYDLNVDMDHDALNNFNTPGGKVGVNGDPSKVLYPLPSFVPAPGDYSIIELYRGMVQMTSGLSDFYSKGVGSSGGNRTATGISQVMGEANVRLDMFMRNLETQIIEPVLQMCASMNLQFLSNMDESLITGALPVLQKYPNIRPEELMGTYDFRLVAAAYTTNKAMRQRNALTFAQVAGQSPYVNQYEALLELGRTLEIPHMDKLLLNPQQVAQNEQAAEQKQLQMMIFEHELQSDLVEKKEEAKVGQGVGGGRPRKVAPQPASPEGPENYIRELAQSTGASAGARGPQ